MYLTWDEATRDWIVDLRRYELEEPNLANWKAFADEVGVEFICSGQDSSPDVTDIAYYKDGYKLGFFTDSPYGEYFSSYLKRLQQYVKFINDGGNVPAEGTLLADTSMKFLGI